MANGLLIDPAGQSVTVTITAATSGASIQLYSDANATATRANPFTITSPTTVFVRETVQALVSLKVAGAEVATSSGSPASFTFEDGAVGTLSTFGGGSLPAVAQQATTDSATYEPAVSRFAGVGGAQNVKIDPSGYTASLVTAALSIATGIGTGDDIVEPSVLYDASAPFLGYEYVLCAAPYYQSNAIYENPTLWVSHDGTTWVPVVSGVPTVGGTPTAVVANNSQGDGNLSDPFLVRGPDGTYYLVYNQSLIANSQAGTNWCIKAVSAPSLAGPWSAPVILVSTILASDRPSSPSMFWDGHRWVMYAVELHNTSATTISLYTNPASNPLSGTWTKQTSPTINLPASYSSQVWWHLNAYRFGGEHVLLIQDNAAGSSGAGNLWLVTSDDGGATFTVPLTPVVATSTAYRSALIPVNTGRGLTFDLIYGVLGAHWQLKRTTMTRPPDLIYGGININGLPYLTGAVLAGKVPLPPYVFGDTCIRANSAVTPGSADSGQAYTVSTGTAGISSNQLYVVTTANTRAGAVVAGAADGVASCEFSAVLNGTTQQYLITRYADASNYIRFGISGGNAYALQNIVAGGIAGSGTSISSPTPASGDQISVVCSGQTVMAYVNGVLVATASGWTSNQSNSGIGIQGNTANLMWRNLSLRALVGGK